MGPGALLRDRRLVDRRYRTFDQPYLGYPNLSYSSWQSGWDVGGGIEWKFTNNISGFAEFRKYNWGTKGYSDIYYPSHAIQQTLDVVRIGLTYNFGGPTFGAAF